MKGAPVSLRGRHIAVSNGPIHAELIALFAEIFQGRYRYPMPEIQSPE
jgi:hypothetical protein